MIKAPKIRSISVDSENYIIIASFYNGITRYIDFKQKLQDDFYSDLKNKSLFKEAKIVDGGLAVRWNDDIDITAYNLWNM